MKKLSARRYSNIFFDSLIELKVDRSLILNDMHNLSNIVEKIPELKRLFTNYNMPKSMQCEIWSRVKLLLETYLHKSLLNFIDLLIQNGKLFLFDECLVFFEERFLYAQSLINVDLEIALKLDAVDVNSETKKCIDLLSSEVSALIQKITGKSVRLRVIHAPKILGGTVIRWGTKVLDLSLREKLNALNNVLLEHDA